MRVVCLVVCEFYLWTHRPVESLQPSKFRPSTADRHSPPSNFMQTIPYEPTGSQCSTLAGTRLRFPCHQHIESGTPAQPFGPALDNRYELGICTKIDLAGGELGNRRAPKGRAKGGSAREREGQICEARQTPASNTAMMPLPLPATGEESPAHPHSFSPVALYSTVYPWWTRPLISTSFRIRVSGSRQPHPFV